MRISVIVPIKNAEKYLEECLNSIASQKGDFEIELIIEDGMSTDKSLKIAEQFKSKNESERFTIIINSESDENLYEAVVRGIEKATGDLFCYISGTDFYLPNAFSTAAEIFQNFKQINWLSGVPMSYNAKGQNTYFKLPIAYHKSLIQQGFYNGQFLHYIQQESTFIRKKALDKIDYGLITMFPFAGDQKLWHLLSQKNELYITASLLAGSRAHENRVSNDDKYHEEFKAIRSRRVVISYFKAISQYLATYFFPEKLKKMISTRMIEYKNERWGFTGKKD